METGGKIRTRVKVLLVVYFAPEENVDERPKKMPGNFSETG
jgi:hypothetical protein